MKSHVFGGKRWKIKELPESSAVDGECDSPEAPDKAIYIRKGLTEKVLLETLIHESLHALQWYLDEETVEEAGKDISSFLWRSGWRRITRP